jgi:hypothetical protein
LPALVVTPISEIFAHIDPVGMRNIYALALERFNSGIQEEDVEVFFLRSLMSAIEPSLRLLRGQALIAISQAFAATALAANDPHYCRALLEGRSARHAAILDFYRRDRANAEILLNALATGLETLVGKNRAENWSLNGGAPRQLPEDDVIRDRIHEFVEKNEHCAAVLFISTLPERYNEDAAASVVWRIYFE